MPFIAIIAIVVIVIILNKTGVSDSLTALTLATVAALLTGGGVTCSLLRLGIHFSSCDVKNPYLRVPTQIV
ncbi:hypothetical protein FHA68_09270 [Escherichia coli]|uniref:hypothetical protein n=1 Tax=Escherichia coli TaxID=562 RepID=UPI001C703153|nr:hypothetical protein [Escherichia coli]MBW9448296.1 hypothetical protein [Escherichia coli]